MASLSRNLSEEKQTTSSTYISLLSLRKLEQQDGNETLVI